MVLEHLFFNRGKDFRKAVHVAPEGALMPLVKAISRRYITVDIDRNKLVDKHASLTELPFSDGEVDLLFASHVLEHILQVDLALKEIHRVLCPRGLAVIEVPLVRGQPTRQVDPRSNRDGHYWIPGDDWSLRYKNFDVRNYDPSSCDFRSFGVFGGSPVFVLER